MLLLFDKLEILLFGDKKYFDYNASSALIVHNCENKFNLQHNFICYLKIVIIYLINQHWAYQFTAMDTSVI